MLDRFYLHARRRYRELLQAGRLGKDEWLFVWPDDAMRPRRMAQNGACALRESMTAEPDAPEPDVQALSPTATVRLAATLVILSGFMLALSGFQLLVSVTLLSTWVALAPWLMMLLGLPTMYVGAQLYRMRGWAALTAVGAMLVASLGMGGWTLFAGAHGLVSCLTPLVPVTAASGFVLSLASLSACQRADAVRERLRAAGMDLGI